MNPSLFLLPTRKKSDNMDTPVFLSIRALSKLIRTRQISPIKLTEIFLDRLERFGPKYNAVVTITRQLALKQARQAEEEIASGNYLGPLHGIPYGAKDLLATAGQIPTTWGAKPFQNQILNYDATVIKKLQRAGAILSAKLAMIELAGGMGYRQPNASFTGPPRNPWNIKTWTGGSSSGSGAAVCAGLVPFAIGSETLGSILSPANNCGVTGLRPTYGRVSRYGAMALSWTLDKIGPLCLTADDCGFVLEAIAGTDPKDPTTAKSSFSYVVDESNKRFKLAMLKNGIQDVEDSVYKNFEKALKILKQIATVEEIDFPDLPYEAITRTILNAESASIFESFIERGLTSELTAPEDHYGPYARTVVLAKDYLRAMRLRGIMAKAIDKILSPFDALVAPTKRSVASPIDQEFRRSVPGKARDIMSAVGNGAGLPSISVPSGFTDSGLPTGIQFMGSAFKENTILTVAHRYQSLTEWHLNHPPNLLL
ncbi:MAG: amidase [Candidatus Bathyarchaeota archaeon]|nr:MAG: amidase [Candidatus Bathyarchaeota archaeon]